MADKKSEKKKNTLNMGSKSGQTTKTTFYNILSFEIFLWYSKTLWKLGCFSRPGGRLIVKSFFFSIFYFFCLDASDRVFLYYGTQSCLELGSIYILLTKLIFHQMPSNPEPQIQYATSSALPIKDFLSNSTRKILF